MTRVTDHDDRIGDRSEDTGLVASLPALLRPRQVAALSGQWSERTVTRMCEDGTLLAAKIRGRWYLPADVLEMVFASVDRRREVATARVSVPGLGASAGAGGLAPAPANQVETVS
jgi:hypothetical protein